MITRNDDASVAAKMFGQSRSDEPGGTNRKAEEGSAEPRAFSTRPRGAVGCAAALMVIGAVGGAAPVEASQPVPAGTWEFVEEESENIEDRIDVAVAHINRLIRGIARRRLRNANLPMPRVVIAYPGDNLHIQLVADEPPIITPRSGAVVPYTRGDGEVVQAKSEFGTDRIRHFFDSDDGQKEMIYRMRPDGLMAIETTVFHPQLPEPFRYTWVYRLSES